MEIAQGRMDVELAASPAPQSPNMLMKRLGMGFVFMIFCCVRAIHPTIITASKSKLPDGSVGYTYNPLGPVILKNLVVCLCVQPVTLAFYGAKGWQQNFTPKPLMVFGVNGALFALDDFLEMASLSKMHGAAYQILNQSKILITALLWIPLKGVYQTRLQWILLTSLVIAMSVYMSISKASAGSERDIPVVAYLFTVMKVTISCLAGVYTDKFAKDYAKTVPLPVQLTQTYVVRVIIAVALSIFSPQLWSDGFFHGWDARTVAATLSFGVKSSMSFTVLAVLDAILKNMAECVAVLMIFFYDVFSPSVDFKFDLTLFLSVLMILFAIGAYVESKELVQKAKKYGESCRR